MKRLLMVMETGDRVLRGLAYRELLADRGFSTTFVARRAASWLDSHATLNRLASRSRLLKLLTIVRERQILNLGRTVDIVYLRKVRSHSLVRALCRETSARIVYDFVDAIWLLENDPDEFNTVLRTVDAVTTDNEQIATYVRQFNTNCTIVPDAPALEEFDKRRAELRKKPSDRIVLGWVGSPGTAFNLHEIREALEELFRRHSNLHFRMVGTGHDLRVIPCFDKVRFSYRPVYNEAEMIEEIFGMHIGVFPLQDVEMCRTRGVLKATNYMCGEAAVIASPVGQSVEVIQDGVNGMLAGTTQEWIDKLELLINDAELRRRLTQNGLETVRSSFRLDQSFEKLEKVLLGS